MNVNDDLFYRQVFADYAIQFMACETLGLPTPMHPDLAYAALNEVDFDDDEPQPDTCHECGEIAVGYSEGTPLCANCYRSQPAFWDEVNGR